MKATKTSSAAARTIIHHVVHAAALHQTVTIGQTTLPALKSRPQPHRRVNQAIRDGALALVLAVGLSATFLSPFRYSAPVAQAQPGRILGESIVVPLHIDVVVQQPDHRWQVTTYPSSGTIAEALAQAAGSAYSTLSYTSRGSSIYLLRFMGSANDVTGRWVTRVNGETFTDLSLRQLIQGDEVSITWESQ